MATDLIDQLLDEPGRLRLVYQPLVRLADKRVVGLETLVRGPAGSELESPQALFREARLRGLAEELDRVIVERAVREAGARLGGRGGFLTVNVEPRTLIRRRSREAVLAALRRSPEVQLVVEITERSAAGGLSEAVQALRAEAPRVRVALDDLGVQGTNLSRLIEVRPDLLKLDLLMVRNLDQDWARRSLVASLVAYGRETGTILVAEGIERPAELLVVQQLGVEMAQGFLLAYPLPLDQAVGLVDGGLPWPASPGVPERAGDSEPVDLGRLEGPLKERLRAQMNPGSALFWRLGEGEPELIEGRLAEALRESLRLALDTGRERGDARLLPVEAAVPRSLDRLGPAELAEWSLCLVRAAEQAELPPSLVDRIGQAALRWTRQRVERLEQEARRGSRADALTGLENRLGLELWLTRRLAARRSRGGLAAAGSEGGLSALAVQVVGLDEFTRLHGWEARDELQVRVGVALHRLAGRHRGVAARWDGDVFLLLVPLAGEGRLRAMQEEVREELARSIAALHPEWRLATRMAAISSSGRNEQRLIGGLLQALLVAEATLLEEGGAAAPGEGEERSPA